MSLDACAALIARGDPDRFAALMAAPPAARPRLLPLYAFNLEVARAPWASREPLVAEMRLQWWRDILTAERPPAHEVAGPLHDLVRSAGLPVAVLDRMVAARRHDVWGEPFTGAEDLGEYLEDTAGGLMWLSALALGAGPAAEAPARQFGWAAGLAAYLRAVPDLMARGRTPLPDPAPQAIARLVRDGLARIALARAGRRALGPAAPALLPGWQAPALLRQAEADPARVLSGTLGLSEFARRGRLLWTATTGRW